MLGAADLLSGQGRAAPPMSGTMKRRFPSERWYGGKDSSEHLWLQPKKPLAQRHFFSGDSGVKSMSSSWKPQEWTLRAGHVTAW